MKLNYDAVFYEPDILNYPLGKELKEKYSHLNWSEIQSHNRIKEFSNAPNKDFTKLKQHLIIGVRKTHNYRENHKVSDWLVPFTSSGCRAMCIYCYLVCSYNKCSYLRVFVNREFMMERLIKKSHSFDKPNTFEIGSNSDLILENDVTNNLKWVIETFANNGKGHITFPTKFGNVDNLLALNHKGKTIFRMSVNPEYIIRKTEFGTSNLKDRINALNKMAQAGYKVGLLIAPVILIDNWENMYSELIDILADTLSTKVKETAYIEIILMTYSYIHNEINKEAFPNCVNVFNKEIMTGRGRGKYCYKNDSRNYAEIFLRDRIEKRLGMKILYIS